MANPKPSSVPAWGGGLRKSYLPRGEFRGQWRWGQYICREPPMPIVRAQGILHRSQRVNSPSGDPDGRCDRLTGSCRTSEGRHWTQSGGRITVPWLSQLNLSGTDFGSKCLQGAKWPERQGTSLQRPEETKKRHLQIWVCGHPFSTTTESQRPILPVNSDAFWKKNNRQEEIWKTEQL